MFDLHFSIPGQLAIASAVVLTLAALWACIKERHRASLWLLLAAALILRVFVIQLDPFLHMWDEAVHAVVAKNMATAPLHPILYRETALELDPFEWTENHAWLHKQPFFLWMMALSIKLGGTTVLALRLPSALFTTALVFFTYGMARSMHGRKVAIVAAILMTWSHWVLMLILGTIATDHNDAIFITLVGGSLWAWHAGRRDMHLAWALATGLFAGLAVLTKWLPGVLVYAGWGMVALTHGFRSSAALHEWKRLGLAFATTVLVALPWQIHAWSEFPVEMAFEQEYNVRHLHEPIEGHGGDRYFHLDALSQHLAPIPIWFILLAFAFSVKAVVRSDMRIHLLTTVLLTHLFFAWSATKMANYTLMLLPLFLIGIAYVIVRLSTFSALRSWSPAVLVLFTIVTTFALARMERIQLLHTEQYHQDPYEAWHRGWRLHNLEAERLLAERLEGKRCVIFNVPYPSNLSYIFFHGQEALYTMPNAGQAERLGALGYAVIVVDPREELPEELLTHVTVLHMGAHGFRTD